MQSLKKYIFWIGISSLGILIVVGGALMVSVPKQRYQLSICAIFKNEAPYLKEWLEFHKLQGVEHFFLYNNNSSDNYAEILQPYIANKTVTLLDWSYTYEAVEKGDAVPWLTIQKGAYTDCLKKYGALTKWLAAIDIDEFLFCPSGKRLPLFLKNYESYAGLCVNWLLFGTSNRASLPKDALLIENLTRCAPKEELRNRQIKTIVQPRYALRAKSAHEFRYKKGYFAINALGDRISSLFSPRISLDLIRINHYWTRTEEYFEKNKIPSRNGRRVYEDELYLRNRCKSYNQDEDTAILQFVAPLKEQLYDRKIVAR